MLFIRLTTENVIRIVLLITRKLSFINGKNGKQNTIAQLHTERSINCNKCKILMGNRADA